MEVEHHLLIDEHEVYIQYPHCMVIVYFHVSESECVTPTIKSPRASRQCLAEEVNDPLLDVWIYNFNLRVYMHIGPKILGLRPRSQDSILKTV